MKERMCPKCGHRIEYKGFDSQKFCPRDGERLREVGIEQGGEVFLRKHEKENISCFGVHSRCGGYVYKYASSDGRTVYTCKTCCLRIKPAKGFLNV